ncbi:MAG: MFS transporter [Clostridia bacterium]|nr:MFS transporter [Clostridia bacterium]
MNIASTVKSAVGNFKSHWKTPPKGRYMSFKEITSLAVGGIGVRFITYCYGQLMLSTGNTLIGNTIGIDPTALYIIYIISLLSGFPLTALRARMIDNTRSMKGKYRPYIISMGIPTVILGCLFIWMPYENMSLFTKCAVVLAYNVGFQFFYNFYLDSYDSLINVLSPNSIERSDVLSVRCVVENLSPSIVNIIFPLLAKLITGENTLFDMRIFRILYPPMLLVGFFISLIVYVNTEEKIVQAKSHYISIRFRDALKSVAKNKYFWIISLAGWIGFLEGSFNNILQWMYNYQAACSAGQYSVIVAIAGNASFWPNLIAPYFIRRYGKKKILIFTNLLSVVFILAMLPVVRLTGTPHIIWLLLAITFVNQFITSMGHLMTPSVNADIRDYQQYVTGERIDGMFAAVGLIGNVITMATGFVLPAIYERSGLNQQVAISLGYDGSNVYDVLFDSGYFINISSVLIVASVFGALMNVIPYFFYDFTETKQKAVVSVLKIRAMFEDFGNGTLSDKVLSEGISIINEAKEYCGMIPQNLKAEKKNGKEAFRLAKERNEKIEIARFVNDELSRFNTPSGKAELEFAHRVAAEGINGALSGNLPVMADIKDMPCGTKEEKELRKTVISRIRDIEEARKTALKCFPDGIKEFDTEILDSLFEDEKETETRLLELSKQMKTAKENGDTHKIASIREEMQSLRTQKADIKKKIKASVKLNSDYRRAAKPYLDAVKIIKQAENYGNLEKIENLNQ